tara:strand:- start:65 stop:547 length:483 start_codon:yes stop_codon:yes gene_type:complete
MRSEDFSRYAEIWAMPEVVCHTTGAPKLKAQSWDAFLQNAGHWQIVGFGQWAIQPRGTRVMDGQTGFFFGSRGFGDDFDPFPEAGWVLSLEAQGKGLGFEAASAAHDWFDRVVTGRTVCMISVQNKASLRLATNLGYNAMREVDSDSGRVCLMTRKGPPI